MKPDYYKPYTYAKLIAALYSVSPSIKHQVEDGTPLPLILKDAAIELWMADTYNADICYVLKSAMYDLRTQGTFNYEEKPK